MANPLPAGTFAYRWYNSALSRLQVTLRSTGGSATYDTALYPLGFTWDHTKLILYSGSVLRVYDLATGLYDELSISGTGGVYTIHPSRPEVLLYKWSEPFLQWFNYEENSYTPTSIPVGSNMRARFNRAGDTLFFTSSTAPFLRLFDAGTEVELPNPYSDVTGYIVADPEAIAFNPVYPQVAMSVTGDNSMLVLSTETGEYIWDFYNPDSTWSYWLSYNETGDLLSVSSDAFSLATHTRICDAFTPVNGPAVVVRNISMPSNASYARGLFTGDGDSMVVCNHPTLAASIINARTGAVLEALAGSADVIVTPPLYTAPAIVNPFWTGFTRSVEVT